jgi:hypothetical protein
MRRPKRHLAARTRSTRSPDSPAGRSPAYVDARLAVCATLTGCAPPGLASLAPRCQHALRPVRAVMNRAPSDSRVLRTACETSSPALRRCPSTIGIDGTYVSPCPPQTWLRHIAMLIDGESGLPWVSILPIRSRLSTSTGPKRPIARDNGPVSPVARSRLLPALGGILRSRPQTCL